MEYKYLIGEYVTVTNYDGEWENWRVQFRAVDDGVTKYVVSSKVLGSVRPGKVLTVAEGDLAPLHSEHAHIGTESQDCDGRYTGGRTEVLNDDERCHEFGDLHFKQRVMAGVVTLHGTGTLNVSPEGMHWSERTDEGYQSAEVRWCDDKNCSDLKSWQRDHTAEAAGY